MVKATINKHSYGIGILYKKARINSKSLHPPLNNSDLSESRPNCLADKNLAAVLKLSPSPPYVAPRTPPYISCTYQALSNRGTAQSDAATISDLPIHASSQWASSTP